MGRMVLLIEDEENMVELLTYRLEKMNWTVEASLDGEEGIARMRVLKPDVVILDLMLPKLDGFELLERRQADQELSAIPVLVLTARAKEGDRERAQRLGATCFLTKPFNPVELLKRLEEAANGNA